MKKTMKYVVGFMVALSMAGFAQAGFEGAVAAPGPVTSLDKLQSLKQLPSGPESRRAFSIQHWSTKNGAQVYFVAANELPLLDLRLTFDAGGARDGVLSGLASTVSDMIGEGTTTRDTSAIARSFEMVGASFSTGSYRDMAVANLRVLTNSEFRDPALDVFTDVVANSQFPAESLARIQQSNEVGQQQQEQSPGAIAAKIFFKAIYGAHPYAEPPTGTRETLAKIKRDDLLNFYHRYYVARNLTIAMVGALSREEAEAVAERVSSQLPVGAAAEKLPAVLALKKARLIHQEFASSQTHILIGAPGIAHGDPDRYALDVGNEILGGGGFTARLMKEVREKRGLTYGVSSSFSRMRAPGPFMISLSTRADQTEEALKVTRQVLSDFVRTGPTEEELGAAKANLIDGFPLSTASNASIVGYLGAIGFYDLPLDTLDQFVPRTQAVTAKEIRAAFKRHVDPEKLVVVTVGKATP
jgi:zinc protease